MTFIDARNLPNGQVIERDICIIGAGPAGLALAKEFAAASVRVAVIESGDLVNVAGCFMARTEARLCALVALS